MSTKVKAPKSSFKTELNKNVADINKAVQEISGAPAPEVAKPKKAKNASGVSVISTPRVKKHLTEAVNGTVKGQLEPYKKIVHGYELLKKQKEDNKKTVKNVDGTEETVELTPEEVQMLDRSIAKAYEHVPEAKLKINALTSSMLRLSNDMPYVISVLLDLLTQQLARFAMGSVLSDNMKIIKVEHLFRDGVEELQLFPLVSNLKSFKTKYTAYKNSKVAASLDAKEHELTNKYEKELKKLRATLAKLQNTKEKPAATEEEKPAPAAAEEKPAPAAVEDKPAEESTQENESKTKFNHYIRAIMGDLIASDAKYTGLRISNDISNYINDLLIELITRIGNAAELTANDMHIHTITEDVVMSVLMKWLIDGHQKVESLSLKPGVEVDEKSPQYAAEVAKKEAAKKEGKTYKIVIEGLPTTDVFTAVLEKTYPTSYYGTLKATVDKKLNAYRAALEAAEVSKAERKAAEANKTSAESSKPVESN